MSCLKVSFVVKSARKKAIPILKYCFLISQHSNLEWFFACWPNKNRDFWARHFFSSLLKKPFCLLTYAIIFCSFFLMNYWRQLNSNFMSIRQGEAYGDSWHFLKFLLKKKKYVLIRNEIEKGRKKIEEDRRPQRSRHLLKDWS